MHRWKFQQAPAQSDLIWKSVNSDENFSFLKKCILMMLIFIISVVLITPILLI